SQCAVCGESPTITSLEEITFACDMNPSPALPEIDVHQLKARMEQGQPFVLLDVREPFEIEIARLPGSTVIPLGELSYRLGELDPGAETIIHCKAGGRSAKALRLLLDAGFKDACHVQGGINAWSQEIDPSVPLY
ncbi:MAG: rhodanese-like domain-containing protein, partial [Verrucomicrobiales bacterium]